MWRISHRDSALHTARTKVAKAVAPTATGKNPDATLQVLDGTTGTMDPAFDAHLLPLKFWATAIWERWFLLDSFAEAFSTASCKLLGARASVWAMVTGTVASLVASLRRIDWDMPNAFVVVDDLVPEAQIHGNGRAASIGCMFGFIVMMSLDVALG